MTVKIELVGSGGTISLQGGANDIWLAEDGWIRTVAERGTDGQWPDSVTETIVCMVQADDDDDLALIIQGVNENLRRAGDFTEDETDGVATFLRVQLENESNDYQALIVGGRASQGSAFYNWPVDTTSFLPSMIVEITRKPFWEPNAVDESFSAAAIDSYGEMYDYGIAGTDVPGDVPARITNVNFHENSITTLSEFWLGWKTNRFGTRTQFVPVWSLDDAGVLSNNTAVAGSIIRWTPGGGADDLMLERAIISIEDITTSGSYEAQRGKYLVLLRALASSTKTFRVQMGLGLSLGSQWDTRQRVLVNSNSYLWYSLGEISFPIAGRMRKLSSDAGMRLQAIRLEAEVAGAGAGTLDMDRLILIPLNEGMIHIKSVAQIGVGPTDIMYYVTEVDDSEIAEMRQLRAVGVPSISTVDYPQADSRLWGLPPGEGSLVFAAQDLTVSRTTDTVDIFIGYQERWLTLGGAG